RSVNWNRFQKVVFARAPVLFLGAWSAYSRPVPANRKQLITLIIVCALLSLSNGLFLYNWLITSLQYESQPSAVLSIIVGIFLFCTLVLMHPIRCILTIIIPTMGTKQGRRLLLSSCFMITTFNIVPNIIANIQTILQMIKCISQHSSERLLNSTCLWEKATGDVSRMVAEVNAEIAKAALKPFRRDVTFFAHTETSLVSSQILQTTERIKEDFITVESLFKDSILSANRVLAGFFIVYLLLNATWYLKCYLTDLKFDNSYITQKLEKLAEANKASHMLSCSPKRLIKSTGLTLSREERCSCLFRMAILSLFVLLTALIIASDHFAFKFATKAGTWVKSLPAAQITLQIKYDVVLKNPVIQFFHTNIPLYSKDGQYPWDMTFVSEDCITPASPPNNSIAFTVGFIFCLTFAMIFLEAYAHRLCRKISASFYERREGERVAYLFEKILQQHAANVINISK
ncbi:hypothetical protein FKM82_020296, partial [Ascaphus truei]